MVQDTIDLTFVKAWGSYGRVDIEVAMNDRILNLRETIGDNVFDIDPNNIMLTVSVSDKGLKVLEDNDIVGDLIKKEVLKDGDIISVVPTNMDIGYFNI